MSMETSPRFWEKATVREWPLMSANIDSATFVFSSPFSVLARTVNLSSVTRFLALLKPIAPSMHTIKMIRLFIINIFSQNYANYENVSRKIGSVKLCIRGGVIDNQ